MQIELTEEQTFTARAGANAIRGLRIVSEWEGLTKLESSTGEHLIVVVEGGQFVKGSPSLVRDLRFGLNGDCFITVPQTILPDGSIEPSFQVGQYATTKGADGKATITADCAPWVRINFADAKQACLDAGYKMITERQWLAIAWNVYRQGENWTGGKVGAGKLFQGIRKGNVNSAQPGNYAPTDSDERRWLTLPNGERICDLNGNVWQWVDDNVQGNTDGLISKAFAADSPSIAAASTKHSGLGYIPDAGTKWSGRALIRGGCWRSVDYAGAFYLGYGWPGGGSTMSASAAPSLARVSDSWSLVTA